MSSPRRLDSRDRQLLRFLAEHRLVLETQVAVLLDISPEAARRRLVALAGAGYLVHRKLIQGQPGFAQIRARGMAAIESALPPPKFKLVQYRHDVGLAWLWLAARHGRFGTLADIVSERRMRSHDGAREPGQDPYAVRLGGFDGRGASHVHYPDLLLVDARGHRLALELELSTKPVGRRQQILGGYGADARIDAVLYLVEQHREGRAVARGIRATTERINLTDRVFVQFVNPIMPLEPERPGVGRREPGVEHRTEAPSLATER